MEMTDPVKEQLSACLDGELPEGELDLLLKQVARDADLRGTLGSYARIGEIMRAERAVTASVGFAAKVSAALADEPALRTQGRVAKPMPLGAGALQWLRPAVGVAIAAGVAAVAVFSVQPRSPQPGQFAQTVERSAAESAVESTLLTGSPVEPSSYTVPTHTGSAFLPASATRLTNYVVAHSEYSSPLGRRTVLSSVLSDEDADAPVMVQGDADDASVDVSVEPSTESSAPQP